MLADTSNTLTQFIIGLVIGNIVGAYLYYLLHKGHRP